MGMVSKTADDEQDARMELMRWGTFGRIGRPHAFDLWRRQARTALAQCKVVDRQWRGRRPVGRSTQVHTVVLFLGHSRITLKR